jgi:hypothetical protein
MIDLFEVFTLIQNSFKNSFNNIEKIFFFSFQIFNQTQTHKTIKLFPLEMNDKFLQIIEDGPRSDLIVQPVSRQYYSAFKCIAVNKIGRAEHIMELREAHLPTAVAAAKPIIVTATTITFDIIGPPTDLGMPIKAVSILIDYFNILHHHHHL